MSDNSSVCPLCGCELAMTGVKELATDEVQCQNPHCEFHAKGNVYRALLYEFKKVKTLSEELHDLKKSREKLHDPDYFPEHCTAIIETLEHEIEGLKRRIELDESKQRDIALEIMELIGICGFSLGVGFAIVTEMPESKTRERASMLLREVAAKAGALLKL